jgi:DNA/RNA endonuclease G (NUC1)
MVSTLCFAGCFPQREVKYTIVGDSRVLSYSQIIFKIILIALTIFAFLFALTVVIVFVGDPNSLEVNQIEPLKQKLKGASESPPTGNDPDDTQTLNYKKKSQKEKPKQSPKVSPKFSVKPSPKYSPKPKPLILQPFGPEGLVKRQFKNYFVIFDKINNRPYASVQTGWTILSEKKKKYFRSERELTNIQNNDFANSGFDKGHLSPWENLGDPSMSVINMVPQYPCHNQELWKMFEKYVRRFHFGKIITTFPLYIDNKFHEFNGKKISIPSHFCKRIEDVSDIHCMIHSENCATTQDWCKLFKGGMHLPKIDAKTCKFMETPNRLPQQKKLQS